MSLLSLSGLWWFSCLHGSQYCLADSRVFVACAVAAVVPAVNVMGADTGKHSKKSKA